MKVPEKEYDFGVIIGRFQIHELHPGHKALIEAVLERHGKVLILLGITPLLSTVNNPLDFQARYQMIKETYPDVMVMPVEDRSNDKVWSDAVDNVIKTLALGRSAVIYGGRDSFIAHYDGKFDTLELAANDYEAQCRRLRCQRGRSRHPHGIFF